MKQDKSILLILLTLTLFALSPAYADDLDDFVPADGESITTSLITNGAVTTDKIVDAAITTDKLGTGVVTSDKIADNAITSDKILNGTITNADIADNALDGAKISNGSLTGVDLANDTITATQIAAGAIGSSELAADAVTAAAIADGAVGASELAANAVTSAAIANDAVGSTEISDGAVGTSELAADAVTGDKILNGTITADDLAAGVISTVGANYTQLEIGAGVRTSLSIGTVGSGYGAAPVLRYDDSNDSYSRWTMPVPDDYVAGTDIVVELVWSPSNNNAGNVTWVVDYSALATGEVVPGAASFTQKTFTQASPAATLKLATTADNLVMSAADIAADDMINVVVRRDPDLGTDTYNNDANLHLVKIKYQAKKVN